MAERFCVVSGGHLAYINSTDMLIFLNTIPNFNGVNEYWVKYGSFLPQPTTVSPTAYEEDDHAMKFHSENSTETIDTSYLCPYVKVLKLNTEYCSEKKFFLCETADTHASDICPQGFDYFGSHCYRPISTAPSNYEDAAKFCFLQNSSLAMLETEDKEWEAKSALLGRNQTFFLSARKYDGVLKWNNETIFSPVHDLFTNSTEGDCLAFLSQPDHPLLFSWTHVKCDEKNSFLCETDPNSTKEIETTTPAVTTTTVGPLECPHGYNWKPHEVSGYCFWETTYETDRLNWFQARKFCQLYGGDLASYNTAEQESVGLGGAHGHYRGLWNGLSRDENSVFHWADGNALNYSNWDTDEPLLSSKSKFCVTHASGSSKWALDYCGVRRWFICRAPKVRHPTIPDMPSRQKTKCNIQSISIYRTMWYEFEDHCYLIHDTGKYTWDTARNFCQDNEAHMASIHSFEETNFILSTMSLYPDSDFWIGLSTHGLEDSYQWTDNTALDFIYWSDTKDEPQDFNTCVIFNKRDGSWNIDNCNRLQGVICKRGINSTYDFTSTEPTTVLPGNCKDGWYNFGNKCYKFFGSLWSQRLSWDMAKKDCDTLGASLVSVHNQDEQDFLTDVLLEANTDVWIGLRSIQGGTIFQWSDNTRMDFTYWNSNEPDFHHDHQYLAAKPTELCVEMEYGENSMGKWNDLFCDGKKGYICQKMKDPTNKGPYHDPFICPNRTDWYKLGSACYGFFEQSNSTWLQAQGECKRHGSNLITYRNMAVSIFVKRKLKRKDVHYWIGVREKNLDKYEYVTGHALFYSNWMAGQPQSASSFLDNCVATTAEGSWLVKSCQDKLPFICKLNHDPDPDPDPEPEVEKNLSCKNLTGDWRDFGGNYCYMYESEMRSSWIDSMHYCFTHGGHLASFHSIEEINRIRRNVIIWLHGLHIGLVRKKDGTYSWVDNTAVDFVNWDEEQPTNSTEKECVELNIRNGKWNSVACDHSFRGFICSSPKISLYFEDLQTSNATSIKEIISQKLTVGGIFGIVICILVILAIIGVTVYYLRPTKEVQPRLLETDNL